MGVAREGLKGHRKGNSYGGVITIYVGGGGGGGGGKPGWCENNVAAVGDKPRAFPLFINIPR